jgi:uncharacterized protein
MAMKFFLLYFIIVLSQPCFSQEKAKEASKDTIPVKSLIPEKPTGWVSDFENIFTPEERFVLDSLIKAQEEKNSNEIAIVTLTLESKSITTSGEFDNFSLTLFTKWGVGKKEKNNGIGILISTNLRKIRIETGTGLIGKLTDEEAKKIIDTIIIPEFKKGAYYTGTLNGLKAVLNEID